MLGWVVFVPVVLATTVWGALALHFAGPAPQWLADAVAAAWGVAALVVLVAVRPLRRALVTFAGLLAVLLLWWMSLEPRNDRDWQPDVARPPRGELRGDLLTIHNLRNFDYRSTTDFTERWEDRTYDLSRLQGVDLFLSYWGSPAIAHTIVSWAFEDGDHLAISIETRKERSEEYSAVRGFFKQFELYYVAADERDLVRLRTNHRHEQVYLYRLRIPPDVARAILLDYVARMNELAERPSFYDAFSQNCTTTIRLHTKHVGAAGAWNWRMLLNGYIDQLLYERERIDTSLPFAELRARSAISARARALGNPADYAARIREGLPEREP